MHGQHCKHAWCRQPARPANPAFARPQGLKSLPVAVLAPASVAPLAPVEAPLVWSQHVATVRMCGLLNSLHISAGQATKAPSHHTSPHVANQCDGHISRTHAAPCGMVPAEQGGAENFVLIVACCHVGPFPKNPLSGLLRGMGMTSPEHATTDNLATQFVHPTRRPCCHCRHGTHRRGSVRVCFQPCSDAASTSLVTTNGCDSPLSSRLPWWPANASRTVKARRGGVQSWVKWCCGQSAQ